MSHMNLVERYCLHSLCLLWHENEEKHYCCMSFAVLGSNLGDRAELELRLNPPKLQHRSL